MMTDIHDYAICEHMDCERCGDYGVGFIRGSRYVLLELRRWVDGHPRVCTCDECEDVDEPPDPPVHHSFVLGPIEDEPSDSPADDSCGVEDCLRCADYSIGFLRGTEHALMEVRRLVGVHTDDCTCKECQPSREPPEFPGYVGWDMEHAEF